MKQILIVILTLLLVAGCSEQIKISPKESKMYNEFDKIAQYHIVSSSSYLDNKGDNLNLLLTENLEGEDNYKYYFEFEITEHSSDLPLNVVGYQMQIEVKDGKVGQIETYQKIQDITEVLDAECKIDTECKIPGSYLVKSDCPYQAQCLNSRCAIICETYQLETDNQILEEDKLRAIEISRSYIVEIESYKKFHGRNIQVLDVRNIPNCKDCYEVDLMYEIDSSKNDTAIDIAKATIVLNDWKIVESILSGGASEEMTLQKALFIAQDSECILYGDLTSYYTYNNLTKTWWIDLDTAKDKCNPACVVSEVTKTAQVNWRC